MNAIPKDLAIFVDGTVPLQWQSLQKETKISIVKLARRYGVTATILAERLGTTRSAILGFAYRQKLHSHESETVQRIATSRGKTRARRKRGAGDKHLEKRLQKQRANVPPEFEADLDAVAEAMSAFVPHEDQNTASQFVTLMELQDHHCRWPVEVDGKTLFCGAYPKGGRSYCDAHHNRAYAGVAI